MTRSQPLAAFAALVILSSMATGAEASVRAGKPNILVILCDDLGYGDLGCFGHPTIRTPNLDKLAAQGMQLTSYYAAAPVCSPSRAGLLTGRTPSRAGIYDWISEGNPMHLGRNEVTIATLLKQAGYATCHSGKWHLNGKFNSKEQPQPGDHGFEHWFSTQNNAAPTHENPTNFVRDGRRVGPMEGYSCQVVVDEAINWLGSRGNPERPFFLDVCFHEPHEKVAAPPDLVAQYTQGAKRGQDIYDAAVTNIDRAVGRLLEALDAKGLSDDTLVFFTSDNGPEMLNRYPEAWRSHGSAGPLRGMKLDLHEGGIRVPAIVRWPGHTRPGQVVDEPVCGVDLLPTLCALAGIAVPDDRPIDGASILPIFEGKPVERRLPLFWHYFRGADKGKAALREGDWKIIAHWDGPELAPGAGLQPGDMAAIKGAKLTDFELYNLRDDPGETRDRAALEPRRVADMAARLRARYAEVVAEGRVWDVPPAPAQKAKAATKGANND